MADADAVTPSCNTRKYTLRSVQSSPGRSFFYLDFLALPYLSSCLFEKQKCATNDLQRSWESLFLNSQSNQKGREEQLK